MAFNKKADIEDAMNYIVDRMRYVSFGDDVTGDGRFNNCTVWIQDQFFVKEQGRWGLRIFRHLRYQHTLYDVL